MTKTKTIQVLKGGRSTLYCFFCGAITSTTVGISAVLCGACTAKCADAPIPMKPYVDPTVAYKTKLDRATARAEKKIAKSIITENKPAGRGRGWHLKKLFVFDGKYYTFGVETTLKNAKVLGYTV
jgi:hypothetical protein